jgi:hypothetical protein
MNNLMLGGALILTAFVQSQPAKEASRIPPDPPGGPAQVQVQEAIEVEALTGLFQARLGFVAGRQQPSVERGPCNMPVIRANSTVDPKMVVPVPRDTDARIRVIGPTICGQRAARTEEVVR